MAVEAVPVPDTVKVAPVNCTVSPLWLETLQSSTGTLLAPPTTWLAGIDPPKDTCTKGWVAVAVAVAVAVLVEEGVGVGVKVLVKV